ncbi:hypothetical protein [Methylocaldum sp.]|uniref:hypothetical protein n=1 Tax=Methylocaldum sp. TaxID=1969727 RepID=UPI002D530590|nr:hypothetical protein [Methylocaldum sp.]HYE38196.1 hypothetical protein [Methylocaldum sp.]
MTALHHFPSPPADDFGESWFDQFGITQERTEFECDWCPTHEPADKLYSMGNGAFVCVDCARHDEWFSGETPDLMTLADAVAEGV